MAEEITTRLIGAEDIAFDNTGNEERGNFTDYNGVDHTYRKLNAKHLPITGETRSKLQNAANVEEAIVELKKGLDEIEAGGFLPEDTTVELASGASVSVWQDAINSVFKNLGGHKLIVRFPYGITSLVASEIYFTGFYNGYLDIDLNGGTVGDSVTLDHVLRIENCHCETKVFNGSVKHSHNTPYGVAVLYSAGIHFDDVVFVGFSAASGSYGICFRSSTGYMTECSVVTDKLILDQSIENDNISAMIFAHNVNNDAHSSLFGGKAPLNHTHTKSNITDFAHTHTKSNITDFAHSHAVSGVTGLQGALDGKAASTHTHTKSNITDFAHSHAVSEVTGLQGALDGKAASSHTHTKSNITDFAHSHAVSEVTGLQGALDGKAASSHTHTKSNITDFAHSHAPADITSTSTEVSGTITTDGCFYMTTSANVTLVVSGIALGKAAILRIDNSGGHVVSYAGSGIITTSGTYFVTFVNLTGTIELASVTEKE